MTKLHSEILRSLLAAPTCPFAEGAVADRVCYWAGRLGLSVREDAVGNLLVRPFRTRRSDRRWFFAAHMDHPGFLVRRQKGLRVEADFIGGVRREYFRGARVALFPAKAAKMGTAKTGTGTGEDAEPVPVFAVVRSVRAAPSKTHLRCRLELEKPAMVPPGTVGMWDLPAVRLAGRRLASRGCDDVAGVAAVLCALGELASRRVAADATGLFTRAEEAGLVGATAACKARTIPAGALVVAIETSAAQKQAPLGAGVVVRVGDRVWTFDASLTADLAAVAGRLAKKDRHFRFTRQLMPGGVCESTAYALCGHRAAGLCLPLGNYHNQGPRSRVAPERIDLGDFESLVKLLVAVATNRAPLGLAGRSIRRRLESRLDTWSAHLWENA